MDMASAKKLLVAAASEIYDVLGPGRVESVYEEAMAVDLRAHDLPHDRQASKDILYKGHKVGVGVLDFIVHTDDGPLVVELKQGAALSKAALAQTRAYMRTMEVSDGLLINFPYPKKTVQVEEVDPKPWLK